MRIQTEIDDAVGNLREALERNPECNIGTAQDFVTRGELRPHAALYLWRGPDIEAGESLTASPPPPCRSPEERVLESLKGALAPLVNLNPISASANRLGRGTGTLAASFGVKLDETLGNTPSGNLELDQVLAAGMPDPAESGLIPEMHEMIDAFQCLTPDWLAIPLPDMQGPFNIAHMILGNDAFVAPLTEPEKFARLMALITDFFIATHRNLCSWISPARFVQYPSNCCRIAECSVNLISTQTYMEHVLPHDCRIAEYYGKVAIHPCSGPHVFKCTLENLPNVVYTEAGLMEPGRVFAGSISVEEAMRQIDGRPVILAVGQELPKDFAAAEQIIRGFLDLARVNPRMTFGFTGIHWKKADEPRILALHRRLEKYWSEMIFGSDGISDPGRREARYASKHLSLLELPEEVLFKPVLRTRKVS